MKRSENFAFGEGRGGVGGTEWSKGICKRKSALFFRAAVKVLKAHSLGPRIWASGAQSQGQADGPTCHLLANDAEGLGGCERRRSGGRKSLARAAQRHLRMISARQEIHVSLASSKTQCLHL